MTGGSGTLWRPVGSHQKWGWVKIKPPGCGPQVLVHVFSLQGNPCWDLFLTHSQMAHCSPVKAKGSQPRGLGVDRRSSGVRFKQGSGGMGVVWCRPGERFTEGSGGFGWSGAGGVRFKGCAWAHRAHHLLAFFQCQCLHRLEVEVGLPVFDLRLEGDSSRWREQPRNLFLELLWQASLQARSVFVDVLPRLHLSCSLDRGHVIQGESSSPHRLKPPFVCRHPNWSSCSVQGRCQKSSCSTCSQYPTTSWPFLFPGPHGQLARSRKGACDDAGPDSSQGF